MKRRILRVLKMTEISGVDRPCQEGAQVTIMKRDEPAAYSDADYEALVRASTLKRRVTRMLDKAWEEGKHPRDDDGKFTSGSGGGSSGADGGRVEIGATTHPTRTPEGKYQVDIPIRIGARQPVRAGGQRRFRHAKAIGLAALGGPAAAATYLISSRLKKPLRRRGKS